MKEIAELLTKLTGIELSRGGLSRSLERHAEQRAAELGLAGVEEYYEKVTAGDDGERERLFDVVGVPHTWFFRDMALLESAREALRASAGQGRPLTIWVPGCATGEDAYSLSMLIQEMGCEARITASDISGRSLERARAGLYGPHSVRELPAAYSGYLRRSGDIWRVTEEIRGRVSFRQHNLMDPPLQHPNGWDLILCRNVLIYFSTEVGAACAERLGSALHPRGTVLFGPGELIQGVPPNLVPVMLDRRVAFRRRSAGLQGGEGVRPPRGITSSSAAAVAAPAAAEQQRRAGAGALPPLPMAGSLQTSCKGAVARPLAKASAGALATRMTSGAASPPARASVTTSVTTSAAAAPQLSAADPSLASPASRTMPGGCLFQRADITAAAQEILEASARDPLNPELRMLAGIALYTARDYLASLGELRAALLLDDRLWPAALYQGLCLDSMGAPLRARAEYRHAVRLLESEAATLVPLPAALAGLAGDLLAMARKKAQEW
ncbi:MAG: protein-glutamate O-methyltransferase CheR [Myxococcales bacterium]|nr:protein-glutamate O-methyltransferase CheR [Myxococcales bacterium]